MAKQKKKGAHREFGRSMHMRFERRGMGIAVFSWQERAKGKMKKESFGGGVRHEENLAWGKPTQEKRHIENRS